MSVQLPTLSASGWVSNIPEKLDRLIGYFIMSDHSQSHLFAGSIASLPHLIQNNAEDDSALIRETSSVLTALLGSYFDSAEVNVDLTHPTDEDPNRQNLRIDATVTQDGVRHSVGREIALVNSKVVDIFKINNG